MPSLDFQLAWESLCDPLGSCEENQDNLLIVTGDGRARYLQGEVWHDSWIAGWPEGHLRLAVLDGLGGHAFGRLAAERAALALRAVPAGLPLAQLEAHLDELHVRMGQAMLRDGNQPGTTLTLLDIHPSGVAHLYHVGDSRLYALTPETVRPLTLDHTPPTRLLLHGELSLAEWRHRCYSVSRGRLCQAFILGSTLGGGGAYAPIRLAPGLTPLRAAMLPGPLAGLEDRRTLRLRPGESYLLASDGLWAMSRPDVFVAEWPGLLCEGSVEAALARLMAALQGQAREECQVDPLWRGDNSSAILLRVVGG